MGNKLFCGGLAWKTTEAELRAACADFGPVSEVKIIMDRDTGRSKGFGFVTFDDPVDAANAMTALDGSTLDGRQIRVNMAEDKPQGRSPRREYESGGPPSVPTTHRR